MKEPYFEAQANFIKNYTNFDRMNIGRNDDVTYFTMDGLVLHIIPNEYCLLDVDSILFGRTMMSEFIFRRFEKYDYQPAQITGYKPHEEWKEIAVIENENRAAWVQKKLLREFPKDVKFCIAGEKSAVQVLFNGEVCGYIMPIKNIISTQSTQ